MKIIKTFFLISLIVVGFFATYIYMQYRDFTNRSLSTDDSTVKIVVKKGMTGSDVLNKLVDEKIITNNQALYLKVYLKINKVPAFQEGTYYIARNSTVNELFNTFQNPENPDIWITIRDGSRVDQVADTLETAYKDYPESVFNKKKFLELTTDKEYIQTLNLNIPNLKTLEGFLFPDKYLVPKEATEDYLIQTLVHNFLAKTGGEYTYKQIIIASMLQKEGLGNEDRPAIAGIINNRLQANMLLQIDATLLYYYKDQSHVLTQEELKTDEPYNTYTRPGLIPTPICSPGLSSISAARNPKSSGYLYYLHDSSGNIHYATTYQEHLNNISRYLK